jgi:hypothetical protein
MNGKEPPLSRSLRIGGLVLLLIAPPAALAAAKPSFETGDFAGSVAVKGKPPVAFTATKKRINKLDIDSQRVRCSNDMVGSINLPGTVEKRSLPIHKGRFTMKVTPTGPYPAQAGTRVTGKLKKSRASGTVRMVFRYQTGSGEKVVCDSGTRKWSAKLDEIVVHLP